MDVDDVFAYSTTKSVKIRDARLGLLHYFLMLCIVMYIVVYQLIAKLGYLRFSPAQNSARMTLQEPTVHCNPNKASCQDDLADLSQLPYCCARNSSCAAKEDGSCSCDYQPSPKYGNYNCTWLGGDDAGVVQGSSILVATLTHQYDLRLNSSCFTTFPEAAGSCRKVWMVESDTVVFTADVESYTVLVDHSVTSPASGVALTSRSMVGALFVDKGRVQDQLCASRPDAVSAAVDGSPTDAAPCYLKPSETPDGLDYFSVGDLLAAAGVRLDDDSFDGGQSVRYEGVIVNLQIEYSNTRLWKGIEDPTRYLYKPSVIPGSSYKTTVAVSSAYPDLRVRRDLHGVLFDVRPGGTLAVFDFTQLLLQLTTSLTLLALSTVGVNLLAQHVLRLRHYYSEALCDRITDLRQLSFLERQSEEEIQEALRRRNLPTGGTKQRLILRLVDSGWRPEDAETSPGWLEANGSAARRAAAASIASVADEGGSGRPMLC